MERILVNGKAGYVGSACSLALLRQGYSVEIIDDLSTGHLEAVPGDTTVHQFDYGDADRLGALLKSRRFDAVFHFAAKALIPESVTNPGMFFQVNVASSISNARNSMEIWRARRAGDPSVLCASPAKSMKEFGWKPKHSSAEEVIRGAWHWEQALCEHALAQAA